MKNGFAAAALVAVLVCGPSGPARSSSVISFTELADEIAGLAASISATAAAQNQASINAINQQASAQLSATVSSVTGALISASSQVVSSMQSMIDSTRAMSCPVFVGPGTLLGEDGCVWAKVTGQYATRFGVVTDWAGLQAGGQRQVVPGWFLGGSFGVGHSWSNAGGTASLAQSFAGSVVLKHMEGPWLLAGALTAGTTSTHITRPSGGAPGSVMQGDSNAFQGGVRLRAAYDVEFEGWYLRPQLDFDVSYTSLPGYQEYGTGLVGLVVGSTSKINMAIAPTFEVGGRFTLAEGTIVRPYLAAGIVVLPDNTLTLDVNLSGPLAGFGGFRTTLQGPPVLGIVEAGVQLYREHGFEMKAEYRLAVGQQLLSKTIALRGAWHF